MNAAVGDDLPRADPSPVELGGGLRQQLFSAGFPSSCPAGRIKPRAPLRVFSVTSQIWATYPNSVGLPSLPLRIGRASGSAIDTSRSVIFSPRTRRSICSTTLWQRLPAPRACSRPAASPWRHGHGPTPGRGREPLGLLGGAGDQPAGLLVELPSPVAFASPVRRASVLEIARTVLPTDRERSRTRPSCRRSTSAACGPRARAPWLPATRAPRRTGSGYRPPPPSSRSSPPAR